MIESEYIKLQDAIIKQGDRLSDKMDKLSEDLWAKNDEQDKAFNDHLKVEAVQNGETKFFKGSVKGAIAGAGAVLVVISGVFGLLATVLK